MTTTPKKRYERPQLRAHGSVEEITQFGGKFKFWGFDGFIAGRGSRGRGPADFGS